MFGLFSSLDMEVKAPKAIEPSASSLAVVVNLASPKPTIVEQLIVHLRADPLKKHALNRNFEYLGEARTPGPLNLKPNERQKLEFNLQLDFDKLNKLDIPPENLAVASEELKAVAALSQPANYKYNVEVLYKLEGKNWRMYLEPIRLIGENDVRTG